MTTLEQRLKDHNRSEGFDEDFQVIELLSLVDDHVQALKAENVRWQKAFLEYGYHRDGCRNSLTGSCDCDWLELRAEARAALNKETLNAT